MGFEDEAEQSYRRPCRQSNGRSKRTYELTSSIVPRGTSFHRWVELDFLLSHLILHRSQAAATSLVHRNSVPSTHMRCMITANRRASATIAFFIPRCLAILMAQALSHDHLVVLLRDNLDETGATIWMRRGGRADQSLTLALVLARL